MLEIPPYMGTNAPRAHQRVIARLTTGLYQLYMDGKIKYEPLPETMVEESEASPTPDVILFDNVMQQNIAIVEVTGSPGVRKDFAKIAKVMADYDIPEGFVYDYIKKYWRKYKNGVGEITENSSFCDAIGYDLNEFLK